MKNNNNNPNNYFVKLKSKYGEDFLSCPEISCDGIQKNTKMILKDIFRGSLDLSEYGRYILDDAVLDNMIKAIVTEYNKYLKISECMEFTRLMKYNGTVDETFILTENSTNSHLKTYFLIYNTLNNIAITKNVNELGLLGNLLHSENLQYNL